MDFRSGAQGTSPAARRLSCGNAIILLIQWPNAVPTGTTPKSRALLKILRAKNSFSHPVRAELCREAMRLTALLLEHPLAATPATHALAALIFLHAARLPARVDASGNLSSLIDQDRSRWDSQLVAEGQRFLDLSATGSELTEYHVEAAIAWLHAIARRTEDTDWGKIVSLYDMLMTICPFPVVGLNRSIAIAQSEGPERGLEEIRAIADLDRLATYPFFHAAPGEFELQIGRREITSQHFRTALAVARNPMERRFLGQRIETCEHAAPQQIR